MASTTYRDDSTAEWQARHTQIRALMGELEAQLDARAEKVAEQGATWPEAGDLGHVRTELEQIVSFLRD